MQQREQSLQATQAQARAPLVVQQQYYLEQFDLLVLLVLFVLLAMLAQVERFAALESKQLAYYPGGSKV